MRTRKIVPRWAIRVAGTLALVCVPTMALAEGWTPWASEEDAPLTCGNGQGAIGFACAGPYCDSVSLNCAYAADGITFWQPQWSRYFSEETSTGPFGAWYNQHICLSNSGSFGVVTGIDCDGPYCDNISLQCSTPVKPTPQGFRNVSLTNCFWSDWVSEEAPSSVTYWTFIAGVQCRGPYCDDKRFYYCDPVVQ
jgi:hypothetical protein